MVNPRVDTRREAGKKWRNALAGLRASLLLVESNPKHICRDRETNLKIRFGFSPPAPSLPRGDEYECEHSETPPSDHHV